MSRFVKAAVAAALVVAALSGGAGGAGSAPPSGAALLALQQPPTYSSLASQRIYFVMTDRYANGDPSNDRGGATGDVKHSGFAPYDPAFWHGGDLRGLADNLQRVKDLGFTALWVTPIVENQVYQGTSAGYHGYWGLDFTHVDPHLGTNDDFKALVDKAHGLGMKVYLDIVVNHTGDTISVGTTSFIPPSEQPYRDCHGKKFDPARYVTGHFPCLSAKYMPGNPYILPTLRNAKAPAWLNDVTNYHDRGDIDFSSCSQLCYEQGDFYGLDDLFTEKPNVMNGLAKIYADWITSTKLDGFRVDTARHVNAAFFRLWVPKILAAAKAAGVLDFPIFGEVFSTDDTYVSQFVRDRGLPFTLDFPLQDAAAGYVAGTTNARALRQRLDDDDYWRTGSGVAPTPPTFLGNHDMGRAAYQVEQHGGTSDTLARVELGYDLLYLLRGAPTVYYGDEVGMIGSGGDQRAREDMFPTQVQDWQTEDRLGGPPIGTGSSLTITNHPLEAELRQLAALRDANLALSTGASIVRYASGRVFVVSRIDAGAKREYVAAFNAGTTAATASIETSTPQTQWTTLLGTATLANGSLTIPPLSAALFEAQSPLPVAPAQAPTVRVSGDPYTNLWAVNATNTGAAPVSVAFAVQRGAGRPWARIAIDDTPPYRAFLDPAKFKKNEKVTLVAVARALDGSTAMSKLVAFRVASR